MQLNVLKKKSKTKLFCLVLIILQGTTRKVLKIRKYANLFLHIKYNTYNYILPFILTYDSVHLYIIICHFHIFIRKYSKSVNKYTRCAQKSIKYWRVLIHFRRYKFTYKLFSLQRLSSKFF